MLCAVFTGVAVPPLRKANALPRLITMQYNATVLMSDRQSTERFLVVTHCLKSCDKTATDLKQLQKTKRIQTAQT